MPDPIMWLHVEPYLVALASYLLGAIPFGLVLTKVAGLGDIRSIGSGNIGATNVLRTGRKGLALATLLLDGAKGTVAVLIARHFWGPDMALVAGYGALIGHLFPVWLRFKGGKGVATYIGVLAGLAWPAALAFCGVWLAAAVLFRFSSLAALLASVATPLYLFVTGEAELAAFASLLTLLLLWKHRANIARLRKGEEPQIGGKA